MAGGKDVATYVCEPTNEWAGTSGYEARKKYRDTDSVTHYTSAATMFQTIFDDLGLTPGIGGLVYLKNGLYVMDTDVGGSNIVDISTDASDYGANVQIDVIGENMNNVVIRNAVANTQDTMIASHCVSKFENITFDGNNIGTDIRLLYNGHSTNDGRSLFVNTCKFTGNNGAAIMTLTSDHVVVTDSIFENAQAGSNDMIAFECTQGGHISGNTFNRQIGDNAGSCISSGGCKNTDISHNIVRKAVGDIDHGISLEAWSDNYENVSVHDNYVENGTLTMGGTGAWAITYRRCSIKNNLVYNGNIRITGPDSGGHSTQIKDINIEGNILYDSYHAGIKMINVAGPATIRNNFIKNSNGSSSSSTFDKGLIYIATSEDVICEGNRLIMDANADTDVSPYGIRYSDVTSAIIQENRILNRNATNPSYTTTGSVTTSTISRSL